ncbi:CLUMA_CG011472, isoform A [Clunio marinus]|uniref:CLUMA_CG011472, isoform A n=1 Tax=Clunio marinus TaxID=568069 RepID=A0A1J1ICY9_9DIPT|nr:CLUMA_CG011472, isoform A [Clunio marinus]
MIYHCDICGKEYKSKFNYNYHVAHHSDERPFECQFSGCLNAYKTKADLRQHQKCHEKSLGISFDCNICYESFNSSTSLNVHKRDNHPRLKTSWCDLCGKNFANLNVHHNLVHLKIKNFVCDFDGKCFGKLSDIARHIQAVHLKLTPYHCKECPKKFKESGALKKHMKHHVRLKTFVRTPKSHSDPQFWSEDEEIVVENSEINSDACNRESTLQFSRFHDENKTNSDSRYVCDKCNQRFKSVKNLRNHLLHFHQSISKRKTKLFKCGACKKILSSKHALERHKSGVHLGFYKFLCDLCPATFRERKNLNDHLVKYHNQIIDERKCFKCQSCERIFQSHLSFKNHNNQCHQKTQQKFNEHILDLNYEKVRGVQRTDKNIELKRGNSDHKHVFEIVLIKHDPINIVSNSKTGSFLSNRNIKKEPSKDLNQTNEISNTFSGRKLREVRKIPGFAKKLACESCRQLFGTFEELRKHKNDKHPQISDDENEILDTSANLECDNVDEDILRKMFNGETYNKLVFPPSFDCKFCQTKNLTSLQQLKVHCVQEHGIKKFKCFHCNHSFNTTSEIDFHLKKHHEKSLNKKNYITRNYAIPNENISCSLCSRIFARTESVKRHIQLVHNMKRQTLYCDQCSESFIDSRTLRNHIAKNHPHLDNDDKKRVVCRRKTTKAIACEACGDIVYGKTELLIHRWNKHINMRIVDRTNFHCLICEQVLSCRLSALRHHKQVHENGKKLLRKCGECNAEFKRFIDFKAHVDKIHNNSFICLICGIKFNSSIELFMHNKKHRTVPDEEKPYSCDLCDFRSQQKITMANHMVKIHGATPKECSATCEICGAFFKNFTSFNVHKREHHLATKHTSYQCVYCPKSYYNLRDFRDHEFSHTNPEEKPYICQLPGCGRGYFSFSSYRWHMNFSHGQKRHQCKICSVTFSSREKLLDHTDENHPEARRFNCSYCGKSFEKQSANVRHMEKCQPTIVE